MKENYKGITLISLIVTILIILIIAGISILAISGENGILTKAVQAKEENAKEAAHEKVILAINASYGEKGVLDQELLKNNINIIQGLDTQISNISYPLSIKVDGYSFLINENGEVKIIENLYDDIEVSKNKNIIQVKDYLGVMSDVKIVEPSGTIDTCTIDTQNKQINKYIANQIGKYEVNVTTNSGYIVNKEIEITTDDQYVKSGLICWYNGINNNGPGSHSANTSTWKDLSQNNYNGTLNNISTVTPTTNSGWTDKSLLLDGSNDFVQMQFSNYANTTIEIVAKPLVSSSGGNWLSNMESGGYAIYSYPGGIYSAIHLGGTYRSIAYATTVDTNKIYGISTGYDGSKRWLNVNGNYQTDTSYAGSSIGTGTRFVLGGNPYNGGIEGSWMSEEIYSVRVYNRGLTKDEVQHNYEIDKVLFNFQD